MNIYPDVGEQIIIRDRYFHDEVIIRGPQIIRDWDGYQLSTVDLLTQISDDLDSIERPIYILNSGGAPIDIIEEEEDQDEDGIPF